MRRSIEQSHRAHMNAFDVDSRQRRNSNPSYTSPHHAMSASRASPFERSQPQNNRLPVFRNFNMDDSEYNFGNHFGRVAQRQDEYRTVSTRHPRRSLAATPASLPDDFRVDDIWIKAARGSDNIPIRQRNTGPPEDLWIRAMRGSPIVNHGDMQSGEHSDFGASRSPRISAEVCTLPISQKKMGRHAVGADFVPCIRSFSISTSSSQRSLNRILRAGIQKRHGLPTVINESRPCPASR